MISHFLFIYLNCKNINYNRRSERITIIMTAGEVINRILDDNQRKSYNQAVIDICNYISNNSEFSELISDIYKNFYKE